MPSLLFQSVPNLTGAELSCTPSRSLLRTCRALVTLFHPCITTSLIACVKHTSSWAWQVLFKIKSNKKNPFFTKLKLHRNILFNILVNWDCYIHFRIVFTFISIMWNCITIFTERVVRFIPSLWFETLQSKALPM